MNGKEISTMYLNMNIAEIYSDAAEEDLGYVVLHELLENYFFAQGSPGEGWTKENYQKAHGKTISLENPSRPAAKIIWYEEPGNPGKYTRIVVVGKNGGEHTLISREQMADIYKK